MVIVAVVGFYIAITMSLTFFLIPVAFVLFFVCMILLSLALGPADRR
jgi:hypothetical protein